MFLIIFIIHNAFNENILATHVFAYKRQIFELLKLNLFNMKGQFTCSQIA